jgi:hypothetical protein
VRWDQLEHAVRPDLKAFSEPRRREAPMTRRKVVAWAGTFAALIPALWFGWAWITFPSDRTPEGAYLRVSNAVNRGRPDLFFAYLETAAQHACFTIRDYRRRMRLQVLAAYPEPERTRLAAAHQPVAEAPDGADVFALYARANGWLGQLRKDMSGVERVEISGNRATVQTVRGTRYSFRKRENGIWGLTMFTATLVAEAERAARDAALVDKAAADYRRAKRARR